ncbi:MAG: mechanosensitive ion channel [Legionellales bacterium]|nr:mechanosensitive ion channel [Legionellales bacterium]
MNKIYSSCLNSDSGHPWPSPLRGGLTAVKIGFPANFWRCCKLERHRSCILYTLPRLPRLRLAKNPITLSIIKIFILIFGLLIPFCLSAQTDVPDSNSTLAVDAIFAKSNQEVLDSANQELVILSQKNQLAEQRLGRLRARFQANVDLVSLTPSMIERAQLDAGMAAANLDSANITLAEAEQAADTTLQKIASLENHLQSITLGASKTNAVRLQLTSFQEQLSYQKALLKLQQKELVELNKAKTLAAQTYVLLLNRKNALTNLYQIKLKQQQQFALQQQEFDLQQQQKNWLNKLVLLNQQVQDLSNVNINPNLRQKLELEILQAQEESNLVHLQLVILHLKEEKGILEQQQPVDVPSINSVIDQANSILSSANSLNDVISRKQNLLTLRIKLEKQSVEQGLIPQQTLQNNVIILQSLISDYQKQLDSLDELEQQTQIYVNNAQVQLSKAMARRQGLPGFTLAAWSSFGRQLLEIPIMALESISALKDQVVLSLYKNGFERIFFILLIELAWIGVWLTLKMGLTRYVAKISRKREDMPGNVLFIVLALLKRNFLWIFMIIAVLILLWILGITTKSFFPFFALILVWFGFKVVIGAARLVLLEMSMSVSKLDIRLYSELKYGLTIGGALTLFMILAHKLPVGYEVTDFSNRLFMLFMLVISTLLLRSWKVVPAIIKSGIGLERPYLMRVVILLSFLVPLTFFSTALIGFCGYVDFAWTLSRYEGLLLLVISVYMVLRGLWNDIVEWISEQCIGRFHNGWLISQAVIKPIDNVVTVALFLGIFIALFYLYGLNSQSFIIKLSKEILHFNLLQAKNAIITPLIIIEFIVAGIIIYWVSRWTRELSFRWLFAKSHDAGLRNSLSAFSQYTAVVLGILISLQIIGIDLTGISYVLGGLAFGAAFGLRDLVKNYASGLLLLIERPVRTGDLISVGSFEGEVTHIGMRSMTIKTWDHMEVLVPNSETFDKPFTNWTHLDSIVRSVVHLKISRDDDPNKVRDLITAVLKENEYVVTDPAPQVYMMEMNEALMEFEVRYFINLQQGKSRPAIRSEVLFGICAIFKQHDIKLPYPPQDIYVRSIISP